MSRKVTEGSSESFVLFVLIFVSSRIVIGLTVKFKIKVTGRLDRTKGGGRDGDTVGVTEGAGNSWRR